MAVVILLLAACEKPRDRTCRALVAQADNAENARAYVGAAPRLDAYRAASAARWVRTTATADADLTGDAAALADALDRLADARLRLAEAREALGARDPTELLERSGRIRALASDLAHASAFAGPEDATCRPEGADPIATRAELCASTVEARADASARGDVVRRLREGAAWASTLPSRPAHDTLARAAEGVSAIADRARAEADVTAAIAAIRARCAS
jgi:hypothetical protein